MSGPISRVLTALELLQSHRRLSGAQLAEKLNVDRRTVRRYITVLEDMGVPVTTELGPHGGYMLVPGFKLPPMMFTDDETVAIAFGLLAARQLGFDEAAPAINGVQAKLERVMPDKLRNRVRAVSQTTQLKLPQATPTLERRLLFTVTQAVQAEQCLAFSYRASNQHVTTRELDPYGLLFQYGCWYTVGFCHLRQALRSFRLDRMHSARVLPSQFRRPEGFDAAHYFRQSLFDMPANTPVLVVLHTDVETAAAVFDGCDAEAKAVLRPHKKGQLLDTRVDNIEWFAGWLAQLPFSFTVIEPAALKVALRERAQRLIAACEQ
ncbi:MAG TPA: YafY family protein [Marinagarivorans sp.]